MNEGGKEGRNVCIYIDTSINEIHFVALALDKARRGVWPTTNELLIHKLDTYVHTYIRTYIRTYRNTYIHTYIHTHIYIHIHMHVHVHMHIHIHSHVCVYIYIYMHMLPYGCALCTTRELGNWELDIVFHKGVAGVAPS